MRTIGEEGVAITSDISKMADTDTSEQTLTSSGGQGITPSSAYTLHASGYHTPELAVHSSSPGSGSFHTANPMDSERSSLTGHSDEEWERQRQDELSSVEIPSLEGAQHTPLASYLGQTRVGMETVHHVQEEEDGDTDVTLRYNPPSALADGQGGGGSGSWGREEGGRNWINQPKLLLAESETIPPCPEKRPLQEGIEDPRVSHNHVEEDPTQETTPLLPPCTPQSSRRDNGCCVVL